MLKYMKRWRLIPRISFINYRKNNPNIGDDIFNRWFDIQRAWGGRLIYKQVKARAIKLDFRYNWLIDMMEGTK